MTVTGLWQHLVSPVRDTPLLLTLLFFWLLTWIGVTAGIIGIWLLLVTGPAMARYYMQLLEARAQHRTVAPVTLEFFTLADGQWRLFPVVPVAIGVAVYIGFRADVPLLGWILLAAAALLMPLSLAVLAITHAPLQSVNPLTGLRVLGKLGPDYLRAPASVAAGGMALALLASAGAGTPVLCAFVVYWLAVICSVTGSVVARIDVAGEIDIDDPVEPAPSVRAAAVARHRQAALNHAYGLISRGNRAGGFACLDEHASRDEDPDGAERWFFDAMLRWEYRDAALEYAQRLLGQLLARRHDVAAMKLMARCLREDAAFRPAASDRARTRAVAERLGNDGIVALLSGPATNQGSANASAARRR